MIESAIVLDCQECERRMSGAMVDFMEAKFDRGLLVRDLVMRERKYSAGLMDELVGALKEKGLRISAVTLYREHSFAQMYDYEKPKMFKEIERLEKRGITANYGILCKRLNESNNPEVVGGIGNHAALTAKKIEGNAIELSEAMEIHQGNPEVMSAVNAGVEVLQEGAAWLLGDTLHPGITLEEKIALPNYLSWVRLRWPLDIPKPLGVVEGYNGPVEAHHLVLKSRGNASLDLFVLPLTPAGHREFHSLGQKTFEREHGIDCRMEVLLQIQEYVKEHP